MNWHQAIRINQKALADMVSGLLCMVRVRAVCPEGHSAPDSSTRDQASSKPVSPDPASTGFTIGPITRRMILRQLRTLEAALRRLIVLYVHVHAIKPVAATQKRNRPLPDFSIFRAASNEKPLAFNLFDPRKRLMPFVEGDATISPFSGPDTASDAPLLIPHRAPLTPRILFPDQALFWSGVGDRASHKEEEADMTLLSDHTKLLRRLKALENAVATLPKQALRLARIMQTRETAPPGPRKIGAIRPGIPPGHVQRSNDPSHKVLRECHGLVREWEKDAWKNRQKNLPAP